MADYTDEGLAARLKSVLDARDLTIREVADAIEVPYRTLQNQLLGRNKMPALTFARLLSYLELPAEFVATGRHQPRHRPIADALKVTFGDLLPAVDSEMRLIPPPAKQRTPEQIDHHAQSIAFLFREAYEWEVVSLEDHKAALSWPKGPQ